VVTASSIKKVFTWRASDELISILLQDFGSAPEIVANRIIATAKDGERDFVRLYEDALKAFGVEDISTPVGVARDLPTSIPV